MNIPPFTWPLAATSWLWPADLPENLRRIKAWDLPISQVALLFYQLAPSLAYSARDFEPLGELACHVHLPLDLPWEAGPEEVWDSLVRLMALPGGAGRTAGKVQGEEENARDGLGGPAGLAGLAGQGGQGGQAGQGRPAGLGGLDGLGGQARRPPWGGVLHPPADPKLLAGVARLWRRDAPGWRLMVENVPGQDLGVHWPIIEDLDIPVCLDVGHLMAFGQEGLLDRPGLADRVELMHCYAPGPQPNRHRHLPLGELLPRQALVLGRILGMIRPDTPILFEVFSESDLRESLETFYALTREWGMSA